MAMAMAIHAFFLHILFLFNLSGHLTSIASLPFIHNGFNTTNGSLLLDGAARIVDIGALQLTNETQNVIGHVFYKTPIPMSLNNSSSASFSTHFAFQIIPASTSNQGRGGYGLAFTLSPSPAFPDAAAGQFMGVFNPDNENSSSNHVFMVEFDTVKGVGEESESEGNHVGVNINGMNTVASEPAGYARNSRNVRDFDLENAGPIQAWIEYDGINKTVNVTVCPLNVGKPARPLITFEYDLLPILKDNMYVGFSAATGTTTSFHYILGWSFSLNEKAEELSPLLLPTLPNKRPLSSNTSKLKTPLIATFSAILAVLVVALITALFYRRGEALEDWELDCPHRFRYKDLHKATKGFRVSEKIGSGGFGAVYRGVLPTTGVEVAVKKIMSNNEMQGLRGFAAEIESLGRLRHKNLVNLQGWCKHKNDLLLVYDYVPNGSLDSLLYHSSTTTSTMILTWEQRFNIIKGIASGLLYLHEEWEQVVIHRDVKSSNVLIDGDMNARLGDFGLARLYDHGKNSHTTNVVGTIGYIAPELTRTGKASASTDVFAYGIVLLEVACGRAPVVYEADRNVILVDWVMECMQMGSIFDAVDTRLRLNSAYVSEEVELVLALGLLCSHPRPEVRPSMKQVMKYLNGDEPLPMLDKLTSSSSREDDITSRLLALGLIDGGNTNTTTSTLYNYSCSAGAISSDSLGSGR